MALVEPWPGVPYLVLNGTSLASGRRMVTSPFVFPTRPSNARQSADTVPAANVGGATSTALDLFSLSAHDHRVSTSVNNSARFPWIESAGSFPTTPAIEHLHTLRREILHNTIVCIGVFLAAQTSQDCVATQAAQ